LASSLSSSLGSDWKDVAAVLVAFEAINSCQLTIRVMAGDRKGLADLMMEVVATTRPDENGGVTPLGSMSVSCWAMNLRNLEAALIQLLYRLDSQLASGEFARVLKL
jgi:hypothetical protein